MKKGLSIPINTLIILVVAVVVLLGVVVFFTTGFTESSKGVGCEAKLRSGCSSFASNGGCEGELTNANARNITSLWAGLNCTAGPVSPSNVLTKAKSYCCD